MAITFEDMEQQAREILDLPEGSDAVEQNHAFIKTLVAAGQAEYETPQARTNALFQAYRADDVLTSININARSETKNGVTVLDRVGYTPQASKYAMMAKADQMSRAVASEHGQAVLEDISKQMEQIESLESTAAMGPTAFEKVANAQGVTLPDGFSNLLKRHSNHGEQTARLLKASSLIEGVNTQLQGLVQTGEQLLRAEDWQAPGADMSAHVG